MEYIIISNIYIRVPELRNRTKLRVNIQKGNTKEFFRIEDVKSSYCSNIQSSEKNKLKQMHTYTHSNKTMHYNVL